MDKTYNDLMDIVNRTKKFDTPSKSRPKPRAPREEVYEDEDFMPTEYDVDTKPKRKTKSSSSLFAEDSAIGNLLEKTTKKKSTTSKSSTTKKAPAKKTAKPKVEKKEEVEEKKEEKPKAKAAKATPKPAPASFNPADPKSAELYAALQNSLFSGGTDISEYMNSDEELSATQESLQELRAKREAQKINAEISKEQQEYEQLFNGSLGSFYQEEEQNEETETPVKQKVDVAQKNAELASNLNNILSNLENKKNNPHSSTMSVEREKRASDTTFELETGNKDLDRKIAEYYKRKQEKIDKYNAENEEGLEPESNNIHDNEPVDYESIFGGTMVTRNELLGIEPEEEVVEEKEEISQEEIADEVTEEISEAEEVVAEPEETTEDIAEPAATETNETVEVVEESAELEEPSTEEPVEEEGTSQETAEDKKEAHIKSLLSDLLFSKKEFEEEIKEKEEKEKLESEEINETESKEDYASFWSSANLDSETTEEESEEINETEAIEGENFVMTDSEPEPQEIVEYADRSIVEVDSADTDEELDNTPSEEDTTNKEVIEEEKETIESIAVVEEEDDDFVIRKKTQEPIEDIVEPTNNDEEVSQEETEEVVEEVQEVSTEAKEEIESEAKNELYNLSASQDLDDYIISSNLNIDENSTSIPETEEEQVSENEIVEESTADETTEEEIQDIVDLSEEEKNELAEQIVEDLIALADADDEEEELADSISTEENQEVIADIAESEIVTDLQENTQEDIKNPEVVEEPVAIVEETEAEEVVDNVSSEDTDTTAEETTELSEVSDSQENSSIEESESQEEPADDTSEEIVEEAEEPTETVEEVVSNSYNDIVYNAKYYEPQIAKASTSDEQEDDNTYVMNTLPENKVDVFGNEIKNEKETSEEEKDDKLSKEEFYYEMARLQENLINELKGNTVQTESRDFFAEPESEEELVDKVASKIIEVLEEQGVEEAEETPETEEKPVEEVVENKSKYEEDPIVGSKAEPVDPAEFDNYNLLNKEVALNEEDLDYIEEKEKEEEKEKPTDTCFYMSPEDKEKKAEITDEFMTIYEEDSVSHKEVGDINIFKNIGNATPSSEILKEQPAPTVKDPSEDEIETIYTLMGIQKRTVVKENNNIKVLYVASECQPFIASGGLADVAGSLPRAIAESGDIDIRVIMPLYGNIKADYKDKFEYLGNFTVHLSWRQEYCGLFRYFKDGVTYYFIDNERYFKRDTLYGYYDDGERFAYFSKAIVEALPHLNFFPDIIHCNDWQSSLVSTYIKTGNWSDFRYYKIKHVYTIHNVEYQGVYGMENLKDLFGIDPRFRNDMDYNGDINLTKAAIVYSDKFTTVSDSYCDNLKQPYCSRGLHHIIIRNEYKLSGIINGIDYDFYNPATDTQIFKNFDLGCIEEKVLNKKLWQDEIGLPVDGDTPMIAIVSRLVGHKGLDLITKIIHNTLQQDIQLVVVGTGDQKYVDFFHNLEERYPTKVRVFVDKYSNEIARKAYAASDIFVMPSKIEPCGLSQMIASRYGSVPIVREVGGLKDSIKDFGCEGGGNGYTFTNYNPNDLQYQLDRAIKDYSNKSEWKEKMKICMTQDFTWKKPAEKYINLYKSLMEN